MTSRVLKVFGVMSTAMCTAVASLSGVGVDAAAASAIADEASRVTAPCSGGPGRMSLTVTPTVDGGYQVQAVAQRLAGGSRWLVSLFAGGDDDEANETARVRAVDGSWSVATDVPAGVEPTVFLVEARGRRGARGASCLVANTVGGADSAAQCGRGFEQITLRARDNGRLALVYDAFGGGRDVRWRLQVTARSAGGTRSVTFDDVSNRRGRLRTQVEFTGGLVDPVFKVVAVSERGRRCSLAVNPASQALTTGTVLPKALLRPRLR